VGHDGQVLVLFGLLDAQVAVRQHVAQAVCVVEDYGAGRGLVQQAVGPQAVVYGEQVF
jgi:hypothetical protein